MELYDIAAILVVATALFGYINYRYVKLPTTIGVMVVALVMSLLLAVLGRFGVGLVGHAAAFLAQIDFEKALLHGMLPFLLFAGALHIDLGDLYGQKGAIALLATVGMLASTFIAGGLSWWVFGMLGLGIPFIYCLLFGALISPTDPVAVLGIVKKVGVPKSLETKIAGESLFNDGVAVVMFIVLLELAKGGHELSPVSIAGLFAKEAVGGTLYGLGLGYAAFRMLKRVDNYQVEIIITLAAVMGGSALADAVHVSAPIAMVVAGLFVGNHGRAFAMSDATREHLDTFWELVDEILNSVLFVLIGLEVLVMTFSAGYVIAGVVAIPIVFLSRWTGVGATVAALKPFRGFTRGAVRVMTWAGLRGGISVALALALPPGPDRTAIIAVTYIVVVFSILVQGLTLERLVKKTIPSTSAGEAHPNA